MLDPQFLPALASVEQDWTEAREWFEGSDWTPANIDRIYQLFCMEETELRDTASDQELDCLQRLARVAFNEVALRSLSEE